ncbi:MAG: B12-binding domain-containing radical SAM protein [Candidatus Scalinduaceae bacterium]
MRICFVYGANENLGVEYLSGVLKNSGHETTLAFDPLLFDEIFFKLPLLSNLLSYKSNLIQEVLDFMPDLVAFSVITETYQWASQIATEIKKEMNVPIVFGGVHPTLVPDRVINNPNVDILCLGEGEYAMLDLANRMEDGGIKDAKSIPNLWVKCNGEVYRNQIRSNIQDLNVLPFPDKDIYYEKASCFENEYTIMASRGCPYNCTFCTNYSLRTIYKDKGKYLRMRDVDNVIQELVGAKEIYKFKRVSFYDDMFTFNKQWILDFCNKYKEKIDLPFRCIIHPVRVDRDILSALKMAGCINMEIGVQSMDEITRMKVLERRETNEKLKRGLTMIKKSGIDFYIDHILGIPYEDEKHHIEAAYYYNELRPPLIDVFWLTHYPKTKIVEISKVAGQLSSETIERLEDGLGASMKQDGSVAAPKKLYQFQYLLGYLPLLPRKVVNLIIRKKWYRFFSYPSIFLSTILPRILHSIFWNDFRLRSLMLRHFYFSYWVLYRKIRKLLKTKKRPADV